ncbi:AbaSI family restriction endonuclease [Tatumella sp. OPLPL6]|uniref:AbaSI family restriction endonuclease n=1 Tax=Tatumella sp. OPLPL6 TaxID=1928657 RepID=UPI000C49CF65|nr:hypothetical protein [Tatumella sp. OPLPL6]PIJ43312.1 hypothetical protein BOM24_09090 [Tatumella sp. OPLPL6]
MNTYTYSIEQIYKAKHKKHEQYVLSRILHRLNRFDVQFITQQYITTGTRRSLTDLYFPAIGLHIEVDEPYHLKRVKQDAERQADIVNATGHEFYRIPVIEDIFAFNTEIDKCVAYIEQKLQSAGPIPKWEFDDILNVKNKIKDGYIYAQDDVCLRKVVDITALFGFNHKSFYSGGKKHPTEHDTEIWWPMLINHADWDNSISTDEQYIFEKKRGGTQDDFDIHFNKTVNVDKRTKRIVFAKSKNSLGFNLFRFKGVYALDQEASNVEVGLCWYKVSDKTAVVIAY